MNNSKLEKVTFVRFPESLKADLGTVKIDPTILHPILLSEGREKLTSTDCTVENLMAGLITVIAYDLNNPNFTYYTSLALALDEDIVQKLNVAAIAKENKKEYDFANELFLAVYHLLPQAASCINLATLYSYMAVEAEKKGEDSKSFIKKARNTLLDGLSRFGEDEQILSELASFEAFMGNLEEAKEALDRYFKIASDDDKKKEMKKLNEDISFKLKNSETITEAYEFISLGETEKALPIVESFITNNPNAWNGYFLRGWALRIKGDYDNARKDFLKCIEKGESNSEIYNELALCEHATNNIELAKVYLETACDLDEDNLTTTTNLAFLYLGDEEFDKAREYLEKARYIAKEDKLVSHLIDKYEEATGEKIGELIHEEFVQSEDKERDNAAFSIFSEIEKAGKDNSEEFSCDCEQ